MTAVISRSWWARVEPAPRTPDTHETLKIDAGAHDEYVRVVATRPRPFDWELDY